MELTGLFFGSFNPIHNGHLSIARYLLEKAYCKQIWFIISPQNPWKTDQTLLDEQKRLELVAKAINGDERMKACDIEFSMSRPSYTFQTLQALKMKYPGEKFALIMGGDNLLHFHLWKNYQQIVSEYPVFVYPRPGVAINPVPEPAIQVVDAPLTGISSTAIRQKVAAGQPIAEFVPESIAGLAEDYYRDML